MRQYEGATIQAKCHDCGREYLISKPEHDTPSAVCRECFEAFDGATIDELCSTADAGAERGTKFGADGEL